MDFITSQQHTIETVGSHLIGVVETSYDILVKAFGKPFEGDGEKTQVEWAVEFEDGTVATIYDWKEYLTAPQDVTGWHIGGFNDKAEDRVLDVLAQFKPEKKTITAWSINVRWSDGEVEEVNLPDDFRQAHKDVNAYLDQLEEDRSI